MIPPAPIRKPARARLRSAFALAVVALGACVSPANQGVGLLSTSVRGPLFASHEPAPERVAVGEASARTFLALFSYGDASIAAAMRAGGVASVHHADFEYESLLFGLLAIYRTVVYGAPEAEQGARAGAPAISHEPASSIAATGERP